MSLKVLIVPDKFKGTLDAQGAALALQQGWMKSRPSDIVQRLPMSDGGDGFGEILSTILKAKPQTTRTVNAAHEPIAATWWWEPKSKTAIIESARVIGLAMLAARKFHPFELDTFGLGKVILAARKKGCTKCLLGIGGSATNDGGFGFAKALGWRFEDSSGKEILNWTDLSHVRSISSPPMLRGFKETIVAVDVTNPLLGLRGCSSVYGPQKGLLPEEVEPADCILKQLARVVRETTAVNFARVPGAGAAGGLGFGLMAFLNAKPESGFALFAGYSGLVQKMRAADIVITGEGALDQQTLMGKGVGQVALLAKKLKVPCIGIAGVVTDPKKAKKLFTETRALTQITSLEKAKLEPARYLEKAAEEIAKETFAAKTRRRRNG